MNKKQIAFLLNLPIKAKSRTAIIPLSFDLTSEAIAEFVKSGSSEGEECLAIHLSFEYADIDLDVLEDVKNAVQELAIRRLQEKNQEEPFTEKEITTKANTLATSTARNLHEEHRAYIARRKEIISGLGQIGSESAIRALFEKASKMLSMMNKSSEESAVFFHILKVLNGVQDQNLVKELLTQERNPNFGILLEVNRNLNRIAKEFHSAK